MPAIRVDAGTLLLGEALLGLMVLAGLAAAMLACALPAASSVLALAAGGYLRSLCGKAGCIRGRTLCWDGGWYWDSGPAAGHRHPGTAGTGSEGCEGREGCEGSIGWTPGADRTSRIERLAALEAGHACFGVLPLGLRGAMGHYRLVLWLPLFDWRVRRSLLLLCRSGLDR